jgi:putative glutamine amidotransferase
LIVPAIGGELLDTTAMRAMLDMADGLLITGSRTNVHPQNYAVEPSEQHEPYDPQRDSTTLPLIRMALEMNLPLLAICRGLQELNVALGGTLDTEVQTLEGRADHRAPDHDDEHVRFALSHTVTATPGGVLEQILGTSQIQVNSLHRQAIARLAEGLQVEAKADDGTIEAVSVPAKRFALALQWHPEYWASHKPQEDQPSTAIFQAFGDAARARKTS